MAANLKDRDIELWKAWKKSRSTRDLEALLKAMDGVIQRETNRWAGAIARDVLEIEAARLAKEAFENYDPKAGTALSTYVTIRLQKLSRLTYTHQNMARLPEHQNRQVIPLRKAEAELRDRHGRDPTTTELAEHLAWSTAAVETLQKRIKNEAVSSNDVGGSIPAYGRSENDVLVDLVYHDLNPTQKKIFEYTTGYGGAPQLSGQELMQKLKLTQGQLSYEKTKLVKKIKDVLD